MISSTSPLHRYIECSLFVPKIFGIFPYSLDLKGNLILSRLHLFYSIIVAFFPLSLFSYTIICPNPFLKQSNFSMFLFSFQSFPTTCTVPMFLIILLYKRKCVEGALMCFMEVESVLGRISNVPKWKHNLFPLLSVMIVVLFLVTTHLLALRTSAPNVLSMLFCLQIGFLLLCMITHVIVCLVELLTKQTTDLLGLVNVSEARLELIGRMHDRLADANHYLQDAFKWQSLFIIFSMFLVLNGNVFLCLKRQLSEILVFLSWILLFLSQILRLSLACHRAAAKSDKLYERLYKVMKMDKSGRLFNNVKLWAHMTKKKKIKFSVCGLFDIDLSFVKALAGATATYSVILVQMGTSF